jgi:hypothetical protein
MAAIRSTIQHPFAGMDRSYKQRATRQRSPYTQRPNRHLQPRCARRTLRCAAPPNRSHEQNATP